jgi:2-oxoglutarate dehydrogenase E1 component
MSASLPYRANADFLESKYTDWKKDPASVEPLWSSFFEGFELGMAKLAAQPAKGTEGTLSEKTLSFRMRVTNAIHHFRALGHTAAHLDPLSAQGPDIASLSLAGLGFTDDELEEDVQTHLFRGGQPMKLKTMLGELRRIYCGKTGFEFWHINNPEVRAWLLDRVEVTEAPKPAAKEQVDALRWLLENISGRCPEGSARQAGQE